MRLAYVRLLAILGLFENLLLAVLVYELSANSCFGVGVRCGVVPPWPTNLLILVFVFMFLLSLKVLVDTFPKNPAALGGTEN